MKISYQWLEVRKWQKHANMYQNAVYINISFKIMSKLLKSVKCFGASLNIKIIRSKIY